MSPQNYDKSRKVRERKKFDEMLVKRLVEAEREGQPRVGGLKLHSMLRKKLEPEEVYLGRDLFFLRCSGTRHFCSKRFRRLPERQIVSMACQCSAIWSKSWS